MFSQQKTAEDMDLWQLVVTREWDYIQSRQAFLNSCTDRVAMLQKALRNPKERGTALRLLFYLTLPERQHLFNDLLDLASVSHSDIELCREVILSLSKNWLLSNIENSAEELLDEGTDEEYRRLLELYINIDEHLTERLVQRALNHDDADIREAGEDFQKYLKLKRFNRSIENLSKKFLYKIYEIFKYDSLVKKVIEFLLESIRQDPQKFIEFRTQYSQNHQHKLSNTFIKNNLKDKLSPGLLQKIQGDKSKKILEDLDDIQL